MSRLTGNDAYGLMEAYSAVYQPRLELTEEQVWEEVEDWVNALIEEGYDLSDYTWEEMYEAYIDEARAEGAGPYRPGMGGVKRTLADINASISAAERKRIETGAKKPGYPNRTGKTEGPLITVNPGNPEEARKALEKTKQKPHTRTGNPTRIMSPNLSTTRGVDAVRGMVQGRAINNPTASSLPRGSSTKPKPSREIIRRPQAEQVDVYDLILSHLLDEGYASSVDAAEKIMVNMSEDWRDVIINEISAMHVQLAAQPKPPAEVRKAPAKKPSPADYAPAAGTAAAGGAALGAMARGMRRKSKPGVSPVFKEDVRGLRGK